MKRVFEVFLCLIFLSLLWWVFLIAYMGIKIYSPGPAIFKAKRIGKDGKIITVYKFRTMCVDSGKVRLTTLANDERIFGFGSFLRKAKIDEFPQIFNVLLGNMEIVGPRPEDQENADLYYVGKYQEILSVKPGLTSPASLLDYVIGEEYDDMDLYEKEILPKKLEMEVYYVRNKSIIYDVEIIFRTIIIIIQKVLGKSNFKYPKEYFMVP